MPKNIPRQMYDFLHVIPLVAAALLEENTANLRCGRDGAGLRWFFDYQLGIDDAKGFIGPLPFALIYTGYDAFLAGALAAAIP